MVNRCWYGSTLFCYAHVLSCSQLNGECVYTWVYVHVLTLLQVDKQQEQIRQLERKLKQSVSEQEHLSEHNALLTSEIDKYIYTHSHTHMYMYVYVCSNDCCMPSTMHSLVGRAT